MAGFLFEKVQQAAATTAALTLRGPGLLAALGFSLQLFGKQDTLSEHLHQVGLASLLQGLPISLAADDVSTTTSAFPTPGDSCHNFLFLFEETRRKKTKMATIFVSVASYRDPACTSTINSIFAKAAFPSRVFVGLVQQNDESDTDCLDTEAFDGSPYLQNIRTIRINSSDAKGPTYARYLCASLYHGETYFCQIDSHMTFVDKWDTLCIEMMRELQQLHGVAKPILSHYPRELKDEADYMKMEETERYKVPTICKSFFNERGMISFKGAQFVDTKREVYTETPFMAAGFLFTIGGALKEVPFDPTLDYVFVGEEILHSVRMWTHGYNIFTPRENIIFHEYTREKKPKIWTDKQYSDEAAFGRIKEMLKLGESNPKSETNPRFGLGHERSLEQFYNFAGINVGAKSESRDFCATTQARPPPPPPPPQRPEHARMVEHFAGPASTKLNVTWVKRVIYLCFVAILVWLVSIKFGI
ncbi:hypothetical protein HDU81_005230 [Chytriomyces hyalinus]|nr:hypothetical protein HDU81_005230 [Chytriomyces hyalinus]